MRCMDLLSLQNRLICHSGYQLKFARKYAPGTEKIMSTLLTRVKLAEISRLFKRPSFVA
jgi:hypothetical protein